MKLNIIAGLLLALILTLGMSSKAEAQSWRWQKWGKCGYSLCKEDTAGMGARHEACKSCGSCCYRHHWGMGWGWGWGCRSRYYYESLHKECNMDGKKEDHKECNKTGDKEGCHHSRCCGHGYYYRGGGY